MWKRDSSALVGNKTGINYFAHSHPDELGMAGPFPPCRKGVWRRHLVLSAPGAPMAQALISTVL